MSSINKDQKYLNDLRHSCSHLMAAAILQLWPKAKLTLGPSIESGFYYDIDFGKEKVTYGDLGGLYQRWDTSRGKDKAGYEGVRPTKNAARAPGEWQTFDITFRAPRFDAAGKKTENARFVKVAVNGVTVHENQEVTGPTRGHPLRDETARGPVAIQGNHGPIAIRRFKVKALELK